MLNPSKRSEIQTLLARQLGHLTRAGDSYEAAFEKLRDAAEGELRAEAEALRRYLDADDNAAARGAVGPVPTLARLAAIARRHRANPASVLSGAEEVLGPLGESHRVYWAGIGGFLWYAIFLILMVLAVLMVFSVFVFPQVEDLYEGAEDMIPALTAFTIGALRPTMNLLVFVVAAGLVSLAIASHRMREAMQRLEPVRGMMTRVPGLASLCASYNKAIFLDLARLLTHAGVPAGDALDEVARMQQQEGGVGSPRAGGTLDGLVRRDSIAGALELARSLGTLGAELEHLSAQAQSAFAHRLAKVREEFTLVAQVSVAIIVGLLVMSMYVPIFKMGSIF